MAFAMKLVSLVGLLILSVIGVNAVAEFSILHSPPSLKFLETSKTLESLLKEIYSASLGLSVDENTEWKGLYVLDPFSTPEAAVAVHIYGVSDLGNNTGLNIRSYPLTVDENDAKIYEAVKHRIKLRFPHGGYKVVNIKLSDTKQMNSRSATDAFGNTQVAKVAKQPLVNLKYSVEDDNNFLLELQAMKTITAKVSSGSIVPDNIVDFYNFRISSLQLLSKLHRPNSPEIQEAKTLLNNALRELSKAFIKAYHGSVLVTTIVNDVISSHRVGRSPDQDQEGGGGGDEIGEKEPPPPDPPADTSSEGGSGGGDDFDPNFSVIFNIMLWFGFAFCFSLIAIVYVFMDMDPGRDSVIYRMTNTRMKKDV